MPSLFQTSFEDLAKSIAGLDNDARQKLIATLGAAATAELKDEARKAKLKRIDAAIADKQKLPAIRYAVGILKRCGLTIEAVADMNIGQLDEALGKSRATLDEKFQIKTVLRRIGILGA